MISSFQFNSIILNVELEQSKDDSLLERNDINSTWAGLDNELSSKDFGNNLSYEAITDSLETINQNFESNDNNIPSGTLDENSKSEDIRKELAEKWKVTVNNTVSSEITKVTCDRVIVCNG